jgi:serine/threonine-protein kinase
MTGTSGAALAAGFGRFELVGVLGAGASGTVYRARDGASGAEVALKVLALPLLALREDERREVIRRFEREVRILAALDHPGIVRVLGAGEVAGARWIAMELVRGETLAALIARREEEPDLVRRATTIVADAAVALDAAHARGVVHRDVKPANILIDLAGRARVTDFGLAREIAPGSRLTEDGQALGTPEYMAPEQARGDLAAIDARTDVYGLGATLYEALCGTTPHGGGAPWEVAHAAMYDEIARPRALEPAIPPALEEILLRALAREKERRFESAAALAAALRDFLAGSPRARRLRGPTLAHVLRMALRRKKGLAARAVRRWGLAMMIAAAVVLASGGAAIVRLRRERDRAAAALEVGDADLYDAARAAARAVAGASGAEADEWRRRALDWLARDLARSRAALDAPALARRIARARSDPDFAPLRGVEFERLLAGD